MRFRHVASALACVVALVVLVAAVIHGEGAETQALTLGPSAVWFSTVAQDATASKPAQPAAMTLIEGATGKVVAEVPLDGVPVSDSLPVATTGASALVADRVTGQIIRVDGATWKVSGSLPVGSGADDQLDVVASGAAAFAIVQGASQIQQLDPDHLTPIGVALPVPGRIVGRSVSADGTLWIVNDRGEVRSYRDGLQRSSTAVGSGPSAALVLLGTDPAVVDRSAGKATLLDGKTGEDPRSLCFDARTDPLPLVGSTAGRQPALLGVNPRAGTMVASTEDGGCRTMQLGPTSDHDRYGAPVERNDLAFVPDLDSKEAVVVDLKDGSLKARVPVGVGAFRLLSQSGHVWFDSFAPGVGAGVITDDLKPLKVNKVGDQDGGEDPGLGGNAPTSGGSSGDPSTDPNGGVTTTSGGTTSGPSGKTTPTTVAGPKGNNDPNSGGKGGATPTAAIQASSDQVKQGKPVTLKDASTGSVSRTWVLDPNAQITQGDKSSLQIQVVFASPGPHEVRMQPVFAPPAGAAAPATKSITVTPLGQVLVPDVRGLTPDQAGQRITGAGLTVGQQKQVSSLLPAGQVSGTTPAAGATATEGSAVELDVSDGKGLISVFAGNGTNGTAAPANGSAAAGVAIAQDANLLDTDAAGNVYVGYTTADTVWRAFKITSAGVITQVAFAPAGSTVDGAAVGPDGTVWASINNSGPQGRVGRLGLGTFNPVVQFPAVHYARALAVGADNSVYIADTGTYHIDKWDGTALTNVVGDGTTPAAGFCPGGDTASITSTGYVSALDVDDQGNVVFGNTSGCISIVRNGVTTWIGGTAANGVGPDGGDATKSQFQFASFAVSALAFDKQGGVLVANTEANRIRRIDPTSKIVTRYVGAGTATFSGVPGPADQASIGETTMVAVRSDGAMVCYEQTAPRILLVQ